MKLQALRNLDAFPRAEEHLLKKTQSGGVVSMIGLAVIALLFIHELKYYLTVEKVHQMSVDVKRGETLPININMTFPSLPCDEASARETLEQVIADALLNSNSKRSAVRAICLAISGVDHPRDEQRILKWLREMFPSHVNLLVRNDAIAALASGTMGDIHGCVLIAGTGTIAYGFSRDGREARAAGAGPLLGDRGRSADCSYTGS